MKAIGLIANPASGKDIRRMVAYGSTMDNQEKGFIVRRFLMGLALSDIDTVFYMKEYYGILDYALENLQEQDRSRIREKIRFQPIEDQYLGEELDSVRAAGYMAEEGVQCIVTLGGDGTNRAVSKRCGDVPLVPISTGTNNVFPSQTEGTVAGMAVGAYVCGDFPNKESCLLPSKRIELLRDEEMIDVALVDMVILNTENTASRAMWKTEEFSQIFLTSCSGMAIGISAVGGALTELSRDEDSGYYIHCGENGTKILVPIAPGLPAAVSVKEHRRLSIGEDIPIPKGNWIAAFDGERDLAVTEKDKCAVRITWNGPRRLNIGRIMELAAMKGYFAES